MKRYEKGFTIVELLIATAVLSTLLVLVTSTMIAIANLYYKGVNQSRTQNNVRTISDDVSSKLQFSDNAVTASPSIPPSNPSQTAQAYCIGNTRYSYLLYRQIGTDASLNQSRHVLWRDTITSGCTPANMGSATPSVDVSGVTTGTNGTELIAPGTRLTRFTINPTASPFDVGVSVAFGENDLFCDDGKPADCDPATTSPQISALVAGTLTNPIGNISCKGKKGSQFCATARLQTTVIKRKT